jgi:hypothetical protein
MNAFIWHKGKNKGSKARSVVAVTSCPMSSKAPRAFCEPTGAPAKRSCFHSERRSLPLLYSMLRTRELY